MGKLKIPDVQDREDKRNLAIQRVGISDYTHPTKVTGQHGYQHTVANTAMYVSLPAHLKGTHMSRFIEIIEEVDEINVETLSDLLDTVSNRLNADNSYIETSFPYFMTKQAPVSEKESVMNYEVRFDALKEDGIKEIWLEVLVPVTSLCPCSKEISKYGAHNQRSNIIATVLCHEPANLEAMISMIEAQGSCELYGTLKREDEKYVTEKAYENPKFVEDIVRDIALKLEEDDNVLAYRVSSENFESIHNHSAYAVIENDKRD